MRKKTGARSAMAELLSKSNEAQKAKKGNINSRPDNTSVPQKQQKKAAKRTSVRKRQKAERSVIISEIKSFTLKIRRPAVIISIVVVAAGVVIAAVILLVGLRSRAIIPDAYLGRYISEPVLTMSGISADSAVQESAEQPQQERFGVSFDIYGVGIISCRTGEKTVGELLGELQITVAADQLLRAETEDIVSGDTVIAVDRVTHGTVTESVAVTYETQYIDVRTIKKGTTQVARAGVNGTKTIEYAVTYINDIESERAQTKEYISTNPVTQVVHRGIGGYVTIGGTSYSYSYYIDCDTTVYTGGGTTATGLPASENVIAVDPRVIPLGSRCFVDDPHCWVGIRTAADTGGSIKGNFIDIYFDSANPSLYGYGRRRARVYILD